MEGGLGENPLWVHFGTPDPNFFLARDQKTTTQESNSLPPKRRFGWATPSPGHLFFLKKGIFVRESVEGWPSVGLLGVGNWQFWGEKLVWWQERELLKIAQLLCKLDQI